MAAARDIDMSARRCGNLLLLQRLVDFGDGCIEVLADVFLFVGELAAHLLEDGLGVAKIVVGPGLRLLVLVIAADVRAQELAGLFQGMHRFHAVAVVIMVGQGQCQVGGTQV